MAEMCQLLLILEVVGNHLSISQPEQLFPGFNGIPVPLMKRS